MNVTFYTTDKRVNETGGTLTSLGSISNVYLLDNVSVEQPALIIRGTSNVSLSELISANYFYISEWDKYYWISGKIVLNKNEFQIIGDEDVLKNFKTSIGAYHGQLARCSSSSAWNTNVIDNLIQPTVAVKNERTIVATTGANDFSNVNKSVSFCYYGDGGGSEAEDNGGGFINSSQSIVNVMSDIFAYNDFWDNWIAGETNPAMYIKNIISLPIRYSSYEEEINVDIGKVSADIGHARILPGDSGRTLTVSKTITFSGINEYDDWRDYDERFTTCILEAPFLGQISIDPKYLKYNKLVVTYYVDMGTGDTLATVTIIRMNGDTPSDIPIGRYALNIAAPVPVGVTTMDTGSIKSLATSAIGTVTSAATSGTVNVANVSGMINDGAVGAATGFQNVDCIGGTGSFADYEKLDCNLHIYRMGSTSNATDERGKPCFGGDETPIAGAYHEYANPKPHISGATLSELNKIISYMSSGFYYT